jgi:hypothetical protein
MSSDISSLIPELQAWKVKGKTVDVQRWIATVGSFEHLIAYATILWPQFVEHDDCVFRANTFNPDNYSSWMSSLNGNRKRVEAMMNHLHILDIFVNANRPPSQSMVLYVGRMLKDMWQTKLNRDFPAKQITVSFPEDYSEDLSQYEISFFQELPRV